MNDKNKNDGYTPFQNNVQALYEQDESLTQLRESLQNRGYDVDAISSRIKTQVDLLQELKATREQHLL